MTTNSPSLNLALQGGGAHGAFTWGVLDALLERDDIALDGLSGASAGAMNAVVLAHGWCERGRDGAREALSRFWRSVAAQAATAPLLAPVNGADDAWPSLGSAMRAMLAWTQFISPAQFNPTGHQPLRELLATQIDFERLRRASPLRLFVAATHANTGRLRIFRRGELTLDALLASACLPSVHPTVLIDGEPYWDGAFSANPPLLPLLFECRSDDVLIVMLNALEHDAAPDTAAGIRDRINDIAFNATFLRELQWIGLAHRFGGTRSSGPSWWPVWLRRWLEARFQPSRIERRLNAARFHMIALHTQDETPPPGETRLIAHGPFLERLHEAGRGAAQRWLAEHALRIGQRSTVDLLGVFGDR